MFIDKTTAFERLFFYDGDRVPHSDVFEHIEYGPVNLLFIRLRERPVTPTRHDPMEKKGTCGITKGAAPVRLPKIWFTIALRITNSIRANPTVKKRKSAAVTRPRMREPA